MSEYRFDPPWGFLPVEQYMIRNWDAECQLGPKEQRESLVDAFLAEDVLSSEIYACRQEPDKVSRVPTQAEIDEILEPFRPRVIRLIAVMYNFGRPVDGDFIFLRTHYGAQHDEEAKILRNWMREDDLLGSGYTYESDRGLWWSMLDDPEHFNLGHDWQRVYKLLPELAVPSRDRAGDHFEDMPLSEEMTFAEMLEDECTVDQYQCYLALGSVMVIFDEEFFQTKEASLAFCDAKGNPIRTSRAKAGELNFVDVARTIKANLDETPWWINGIVGKKYKSMFDRSRANKDLNFG